MKNVWLVMKHDASVILRQPSFWILAVLLPILLVAFQALAIFKGGEASQAGKSEAQAAVPASLPAIGLVDPAGLLAHFPPGFAADSFVRFADEATARTALKTGIVEQAVYIPEDYLTSGQVTVYDKDFQILSGGSATGVAFSANNAWILGYLIGYNLTGDAQLITALHNPTPGDLAQKHVLNPKVEASTENRALADLVSRLVPYAFYFLLVMGSSYLMRSVVAEKENRTAEVLLVSLDPRQLMVGKILAASLVLVVQVVIWVGGGALALNRGADLLRLGRFEFPPGFLVWALLFLVLGYLLFAAVMAAAGAIATSMREANQAIWLLVVPLMPTLMFGPLLIESPGSPLVLVLSLFPFSSPSAMVTRLAVQAVPLWQIGLSLVLLAATTYVVVGLAARFFRADNFLSAESFNWRRFLGGWRGRQA
jgi:ABC-2 type transport system permease protein